MRPARVLLAIGALAVAGCDRKPAAVESSASGQEQASPPPAATPPPALAMPQGRFEAITNTAMGVTGDLDASGREFRFAQGQAYRLAAVGRQAPEGLGGVLDGVASRGGDRALRGHPRRQRGSRPCP